MSGHDKDEFEDKEGEDNEGKPAFDPGPGAPQHSLLDNPGAPVEGPAGALQIEPVAGKGDNDPRLGSDAARIKEPEFDNSRNLLLAYTRCHYPEGGDRTSVIFETENHGAFIIPMSVLGPQFTPSEQPGNATIDYDFARQNKLI